MAIAAVAIAVVVAVAMAMAVVVAGAIAVEVEVEVAKKLLFFNLPLNKDGAVLVFPSDIGPRRTTKFPRGSLSPNAYIPPW